MRATIHDNLFQRERFFHHLLFALKIAFGSCIAIWLAQKANLDYATSAGTITLLTIISTKWGTVRLAVSRVITFIITVVLSALFFGALDREWLTFGLFILFVTFISCILGWGKTISVNAVIGTHFMADRNFGPDAIFNELCLLLIGVSMGILFNLFHNNSYKKKCIIHDIHCMEERVQHILLCLADLLQEKEVSEDIEDTLDSLEKNLNRSLERAIEYQENTFVSHPEYYIRYVQMRINQCESLRDLNSGIQKIRKMPQQSIAIADFIHYMCPFVTEMNIPTEQLIKLANLRHSYQDEMLPTTREEFESRAVLFHILMDLEEFLLYKSHFVDGLEERHKMIYWDK